MFRPLPLGADLIVPRDVCIKKMETELTFGSRTTPDHGGGGE